ncbi:MAG: divalent-cation tolerance protein CutA [Gemmatimonadales bacterium]|nr:divalent-cation tolerance protein CutA [Gemmatimonadales bacterium]
MSGLAPATTVVEVVTTLPDRAAAEAMAAALVSGRLAACVQVDGPVRSVYRWQGAVESAEEWRLTCKTAHTRLEALADTIRARHPYDVPELLVRPLLAGGAAYVQWILDETTP